MFFELRTCRASRFCKKRPRQGLARGRDSYSAPNRGWAGIAGLLFVLSSHPAESADLAEKCRSEAERSAQAQLLKQEGYTVTAYVLDPEQPDKWQPLLDAQEKNTPSAYLGACGDTRLQIYLVASKPALRGRVEENRDAVQSPQPKGQKPASPPSQQPATPPLSGSESAGINLECRGTYTECYGHRPRTLPGYSGVNSGPTAPQKPRGPTDARPIPPTGQPVDPVRSPTIPGAARKTVRICDLRELAAVVMQRYGTGKPIARVRLVNTDRPVYVVFLAGVELTKAQGNDAGAALLAFQNVQALDVYRLALLDALVGVPIGSDLILVGHSLGGMTAQNAVANLVHRWGYRVVQVVSYGSPIMAEQETTTRYLHVRAKDEPLQALDKQFNLGVNPANRIVMASTGQGFPFSAPDGAHFVYDKPRAGLSRHPVPVLPGLQATQRGAMGGLCWELDPDSLVEQPAPNFLQRLASPRPPHEAHPVPPPHNPELGYEGSLYNCFWVALVQDSNWRQGDRGWASCSPRPIPHEEAMAVLGRTYGHLVFADGHGLLPGARRRQQLGVLTPTRTEKELSAFLPSEGSQALLFVRNRPPGKPSGEPQTASDTSARALEKEPSGHVLNVRRHKGVLEYWDAQGGYDGRMWLDDPGLVSVEAYRTR